MPDSRFTSSTGQRPHHARERTHLRSDAMITLAATSAVVLALAWGLARTGHADSRVLAGTAGCLALICGAAWHGLPAHPHRRFGLANILTTIRAGLTALLGALIFEADALGPPAPTALAWFATVVAVLALSLDGVDGYAARRNATSSAYGARFDMEIDALMILFLAALVFAADKAGIWVLGIGLMRYLFIGVGWFVPRLRDELPPSMRRKTICAAQGIALCVSLTPLVGADLASVCVAAALASLVYSFAVDVVYLSRPAAHRAASQP